MSPRGGSAAGCSCSRLGELALQVLGQFGNGREVKELSQLDLPGVLAIDALVDLDELERAGADLEQVVVDVHALAFEGSVADGLELLLDLGATAGLRAACRFP